MLHQFVSKPNYFPNMERREGRGGRLATIDNVYEHDESARDEKLEALLVRMNWQFEQFGDWFNALADQLAALAISNGCHHQPFAEERIASMENPSIIC
jgi:hypothetical protein